MTNKVYDVAKNVALFAVPVLTFGSALCVIWNVPHSAEITATLSAIDTMLGGFVIAAKKSYDKES